jgi:hypothetical protein
LAPFDQKGGKPLLIQGWSDSAIAPQRVIDYYKEVREQPGPQNAAKSVRLFMAPGMFHCGGGPGPNDFDTLTALEKWVEGGVVPQSLYATHYDDDGNPDRTRPLCAYPKVARYDGSGSINKALNFSCVYPAKTD